MSHQDSGRLTERLNKLLARIKRRSTEEWFLDVVVPVLYREYPDLAVHYSEHEQLMLLNALWWRHFGWAVFPTRGKVPAIASPHRDADGNRVSTGCKGECGLDGHGHHDATTDAFQIIRWWTGPARGADISAVVPDHYLCLDDDPRHGGDESLARLQAEHGELPETLEFVSGRGDGGRHRFFRRCPGELNPTIAEGVEVKQVSVMPWSLHDTTGMPYELVDRPVAESPEWLLRMAVKPPAPPAPPRPRRKSPYTGPPVIEDFNASGDWGDLLTRHGWRCVSGDPDDGHSMWRHPDATHETSASLREDADGKRRLYVFSTSTPFEPTTPGSPCGHDYFDAVAVLEHGGDRAALMRAIRKDLFGKRGR
jgi:hypothetical protein